MASILDGRVGESGEGGDDGSGETTRRSDRPAVEGAEILHDVAEEVEGKEANNEEEEEDEGEDDSKGAIMDGPFVSFRIICGLHADQLAMNMREKKKKKKKKRVVVMSRRE